MYQFLRSVIDKGLIAVVGRNSKPRNDTESAEFRGKIPCGERRPSSNRKKFQLPLFPLLRSDPFIPSVSVSNR
jgi:hypothetical protein